MSREPIYFYLTGNWYTGKMPNFYDVSELDSTPILMNSYAEIKEEVLAFLEKTPNGIKPNKTPAKYKEEGWKNMSLYAFMVRFDNNLKHFPKLTRTVQSIPNMISAQIAILEPGTRVKAHFGDSNTLIRSHLGLVVPGKLPELGFRNGSQERCWEEGKVLAICISHRHYVWNYTNQRRVILIVDTMHPDFAHQQYYICSSLHASQAMKIFTSKYPKLKKMPKFAVPVIHKLFTIPIFIVLLLQNKFNISLVNYVMKFRDNFT